MIHHRPIYRLGLDIGTNSLGFALVSLRDDSPEQILHMGSRIFSDGREDKTGASLAVARRTARGMRRRRDRLVRRKEQLIELLVSKGLMPTDKPERKALEQLDPYLLRKQGLDQPLSPYEIGRALFHINQRRGFQSNRKSAEKDVETGTIKSASQQLRTQMEEMGCRSYGEFLFSSPTKRIRNMAQKANETVYAFYPTREILKAEYDTLIAAQSAYHPKLLNAAASEEIKQALFHQRDLCPAVRGKCTLLGKEQLRAYAALPSSQYFRLLKEINNLKITDRHIRRNWEYLSDEQRTKALAILSKQAEVKFSSLAKKIGLSATESFNLESDVRDKIYGLDTAITLARPECFGEFWSVSLKEQDRVVMELLEHGEAENEAWLRAEFPALSDEQIDRIITASGGLEDGTLRYSTQAIEQLIPQLESKDPQTGRYKDEYQAIISCGHPYASHYTGEIMMEELPYYGVLLEHKTQAVKYGSALEKEHGRIANPTVHVALNQLRKVVNEIIAEYGHPKEIALEFSRELKLTKKEKENRNRENRKNQQANERYDANAREKGVVPSDDTRLRQKLWEQQDECCAYSGKKISLSELLSDEVEIDHILPFSQTFDDSNANKVVVLRRLNRFKKNRTPHQAFCEDSHPEVNWEELLLRVAQTIPNKRSRFEAGALEKFIDARKSGDSGWVARQLTDTSYMARVAREYLRYVVGDRVKGFPAVDTYPGGMTAKLRRGWGFNSLLPADPDGAEKNRTDHRHHAIDALVIACANRSLLQQISRASAKGEELGETWYKNLAEKSPPYSAFNREALQQMVDHIVVSHKPDHGTPGRGSGGSTTSQLHEDTFYGLAKNQRDVDDGKIRLVVRRPLVGLKESDITKICDSTLRRRIAYAVAERPADQKYEEAIASFARENNIRRVRVFEEKGAKAMKAIHDRQGKPYRYVATGGNHHIDIFCPIKDRQSEDGKKYKAGKWYAETISHFDYNQKNFEPRWRTEHPTAKLVMRLHINDMVAYEENGKREIRRVKKIDATTERVYLVSHLVAFEQADKLSWAASANKLQEKNARKVAVTPSGRLLDPGKAPMPKPLCRDTA